MLKLIKLEWQKSNITGYFKGLAVCIIAIFAAVSLMALGSRGESEPMFENYAAFMSLADILTRITYIIFASVILSRLVIEEYKSNMIQVLFTYPLQRKKSCKPSYRLYLGFAYSASSSRRLSSIC